MRGSEVIDLPLRRGVAHKVLSLHLLHGVCFGHAPVVASGKVVSAQGLLSVREIAEHSFGVLQHAVVFLVLVNASRWIDAFIP